ncbi:MAG: branched-chain amino acid transaminase [Candidatus Sericytochromatia bacterium]|nr:branched-chain amino acid transaminase [Candidatus Sericytochromatia bacterium]
MATKPSFVFFRGQFVPFEEAKVGVMTHGLNYGTGCFEGIRGYWNADKNELFVLKMRPHFERLHQSARILYMNLPYSVDELCEITLELIRRNGFREDVYIRPLLYMGDEIIGVRLHKLNTDFTMFATPMGDYIDTTGIKVGVSSWRRLDDNAVPARAKITGAYINSALAKTEAYHNGFDDAIFLNADGHVSEGSAMNLFLVRHGELVTPGVQHNILEGVTRRAVMRIAREELGIATDERSVDRTELYIADEMFLCGTGAQISPVTSIDHRPVGGTEQVGPVTRQIMEIYNRAVRGNHPSFTDWVTPVYMGALPPVGSAH